MLNRGWPLLQGVTCIHTMMVLIDSLYINNSGGLRLLEYLVQELKMHGIPYHLLADSRCIGLFDNSDVEYLKASMRNRARYYRNHDVSSEYTSVLCFGNIPPPVKLSIPVYTYFHCIKYLTLQGLSSFKELLKSWAKREVFRKYKRNTDFWIVQTTNTKNELIRHLKEEDNRVLMIPFFDIPDSLFKLAKMPHGDDYVYVAIYTASKQHEELLDAWSILHDHGYDMTLHLTVPFSEKTFLAKVRKAQEKGVKVINHGFVPFEEVMGLYAKSKAIIYPSQNESLGLGVVEAIIAGCDVLGADLPYIHAICKPSVIFNHYSAQSIADAVIAYEKGDSVRSELMIRNMINELLELLRSSR